MKTIPTPSRSSLLLLAVACLTGLPACGSGPDPDALHEGRRLDLYEGNAMLYYEMGDLDRAEDQARKGLDLDPECMSLKLLLGYIHQQLGQAADLQVAEAVFRDVAETGDYRALLGLGKALERRGVLAREAAEAVRAGERFTEAVDPEARAAELHAEAQQIWAESSTAYQDALASQARNIQAFSGLMRVAALSGDYEGSLAWSRELLAVLDEELAFRRMQLDLPDLTARQEQNLRSQIGEDEDLQVTTHLHAADVLQRLGRGTEALTALDLVLDLRPDRAEAFSRRGQLLSAQERWEEAVASLDEFLRLSNLTYDHPDIQQAYELRSVCSAARRREEQRGESDR